MLAILFPGQGSQKPGMGAELFPGYPRLLAEAERILGYSVAEICLRNPDGRLNRTEFTQPVLFTVNHLHFLEYQAQGRPAPDFLAGHSLGEYNALLAAGAFDFATGLSLVRERARLMAQAGEGAMAAVVGLPEEEVAEWTREKCPELDVANFNSPRQVVLSGPKAEILAAGAVFGSHPGVRFLPLRVSGAFHSRRMREAAAAFAAHLERIELHPLRIPVLSNRTGRPHDPDVKSGLAAQIDHSVRWTDCIRYMLAAGVDEFQETGPARILTPLVDAIRAAAPSPSQIVPAPSAKPAAERATEAAPATAPDASAATDAATEAATEAATAPPAGEPLADRHAAVANPGGFLRDFSAARPLYFGATGFGIASPDQVAALCGHGYPAILETWDTPLPDIRRAYARMRARNPSAAPTGLSLRPGASSAGNEEDLERLILDVQAPLVEAQGYVRVTPALVACRAKGMTRGPDGPVPARKLVVRVPYARVAGEFLNPPPEALLRSLAAAGRLTPEEAGLAAAMPIADALVVDGDRLDSACAGGPIELLARVLELRDSLAVSRPRAAAVHIGISGGVARPDLAAAAFFLGASFICFSGLLGLDARSRLSPAARELLAAAGPDDTGWCPDLLFLDHGGQRRVLRKGTLFCQRAAALERHAGERYFPESLPGKARKDLESLLGMDLDAVRSRVREVRPSGPTGRGAEPGGSVSFAGILDWYLRAGLDLARRGTPESRMDWHLPCGSDVGLFNAWSAGRAALPPESEPFPGRIAEFLDRTASLLEIRASARPSTLWEHS